MGTFFDGLGSILDQQFSTGDNHLKSLDIVKNGQIQKDKLLGTFAQNVDTSAQRQYVEEGSFRTDLFNPHPKQLEILMQEPDVTILIKKRAFSSLADNYKKDLFDKDEQLFVRATKILFQNKAKQISAYERLTKIEKISKEIGSVDYHLLPAIFAATDVLTLLPGFDKFKNVVDKVKMVVNLNQDTNYTTWITNITDPQTEIGNAGTGVIELTLATSVQTTVSTNFGMGSFSLEFQDPYNLMRITNDDIEQAIADATNVVLGNTFLQLGQKLLQDTTETNKTLLNQIRSARNANPIIFQVDPDTFLGKRVRALVDNVGEEIIFTTSLLKTDIDANFTTPTGTLGNDYLAGSGQGSGQGIISQVLGGVNLGKINAKQDEVSLFQDIVGSIYNSLQINQNAQTTTKKHNSETNNLRKKIRLHYGKHLIIQAMDVVNIFVSSKTREDTKILGGLQDTLSGFGLLQTIDKGITNIQDFFNAGQDSSIEKSLLVGSDFPNWLWLLLRNQFTNDKSGTHICAGLVQKSSSSYNDGKFVVSISGTDNSTYFNLGIVNYKPALEAFNGSLYDPLTPFDIKFDSATGFPQDSIPQLLGENKDLFQSVFAKYKSGIYVGRKPTVKNYIQDTDNVQNTANRRVFYDPDGMVYKWKEGIGALVLFGNSYSEDSADNQTFPIIANDPFAGQDIMNALSLLITGEPYNFATFYKAASQFDNFARDATTGTDPSVSYFKNFQNDLKYRNLLYGNFVPFKKMTMDENTYKNVLNNIINATAYDQQLNDLLTKKATLSDQILSLTNNGQANGLSIRANDLQKTLDQVNSDIDAKVQSINTELNSANKPLTIIGNDTSTDYNSFLNTPDKNKLSNSDQNNRELRRKTHYLTRRLSWKVRGNEDINLFIVDDTYDKDYDIQAFEKSFVNPDLFKSDYITPSDQIERIAKILDLEVFADTQGHIQIRPPQYNKVPSSVFYRMLRLKQEFDIQIYPQFLEDLYVNQIDNAISRIEVLEDEIRLYGIALSSNTDDGLATFLSSQSQNIAANGNSTPFQFISDRATGTIPQVVLHDLATSDDPLSQLQTFSGGLNALSSIQTQATINNIFSVSTRSQIIKDGGLNAAAAMSNTTQTDQDAISARLEQKTGQKFDFSQLFPNSRKLLGGTAISNVDLLKILQEIASRISERQRIIKIAAGAIKNAKESVSLIQNKDNVTNKLTVPGLLGNSEIPQAFDSLIEDEAYDDYGPGSGQRFVLKNKHIKSMRIEENVPSFTSVEVVGNATDNFAISLPASLNGFQGGGNALTTASAVDYDMWRMYGNRRAQTVQAPYLTDPKTQCAPFAVALLNKARQNIFGGTISIVGNEYMQPGEVVYVENQDCLYYIESVNHNISYGKDFTTSLNVAYGHMPGEYIPTYLDTVGKILYSNKDITNYINVRQDNVNNEQAVGTFIMGDDNNQTLNDILQASQSVFSTSITTSYQPNLEIRVYHAKNHSPFNSSNSDILNFANQIKQALLGTNGASSLTLQDGKPQNFLNNNSQFVNVIEVDADDTKENRSPSLRAYHLARQQLLKTPVGSNNNSIMAVDQMIYTYVVDCWIRFENPKVD